MTFQDDQTTAILYAERCEQVVKLADHTTEKARKDAFASIILSAIIEARKRSEKP